jgi:cholinesterase
MLPITHNSIGKVEWTYVCSCLFGYILGFLYLSRENKGDYALQDIYTALHWLKNYVTNFNGDPDRITLYGTGSGAVLASLVVMLETVNGS